MEKRALDNAYFFFTKTLYCYTFINLLHTITFVTWNATQYRKVYLNSFRCVLGNIILIDLVKIGIK